MRAYDDMYLDDAMQNLGIMFEYAIVTCGEDPDGFAYGFASSEWGRFFSSGHPMVLSGMSGIELARRFMSGGDNQRVFPDHPLMEPTPEYWAGWALAYYQWHSAHPLHRILARIPFTEVLSLYRIHHEADVSMFVDTMEQFYHERPRFNNLKVMRERWGMSQRELSERSGVPVRSIQLYEQGVNDIDRAQSHTVYALAWVLGCRMEDLLEEPESKRISNASFRRHPRSPREPSREHPRTWPPSLRSMRRNP